MIFQPRSTGYVSREVSPSRHNQFTVTATASNNINKSGDIGTASNKVIVTVFWIVNVIVIINIIVIINVTLIVNVIVIVNILTNINISNVIMIVNIIKIIDVIRIFNIILIILDILKGGKIKYSIKVISESVVHFLDVPLLRKTCKSMIGPTSQIHRMCSDVSSVLYYRNEDKISL